MKEKSQDESKTSDLSNWKDGFPINAGRLLVEQVCGYQEPSFPSFSPNHQSDRESTSKGSLEPYWLSLSAPPNPRKLIATITAHLDSRDSLLLPILVLSSILKCLMFLMRLDSLQPE